MAEPMVTGLDRAAIPLSMSLYLPTPGMKAFLSRYILRKLLFLALLNEKLGLFLSVMLYPSL